MTTIMSSMYISCIKCGQYYQFVCLILPSNEWCPDYKHIMLIHFTILTINTIHWWCYYLPILLSKMAFNKLLINADHNTIYACLYF